MCGRTTANETRCVCVAAPRRVDSRSRSVLYRPSYSTRTKRRDDRGRSADVHRREVDRGRERQDVRRAESGHRSDDRQRARRRRRRHAARDRRCAARVRRRSVAQKYATRARARVASHRGRARSPQRGDAEAPRRGSRGDPHRARHTGRCADRAGACLRGARAPLRVRGAAPVARVAGPDGPADELGHRLPPSRRRVRHDPHLELPRVRRHAEAGARARDRLHDGLQVVAVRAAHQPLLG